MRKISYIWQIVLLISVSIYTVTHWTELNFLMSLSMCLSHSFTTPVHPSVSPLLCPPPLSKSLCASSIISLPPFVSLWLVARGEGCFGVVQAKDKSPQATTQTHWEWQACTPTITNTYLGRGVFCVLGTCVTTIGQKIYMKILQAPVKCCHESTVGCWGPNCLPDCHPDWVEKGIWGTGAASCIFYNLFCSHLLPDTHAYWHTNKHTRTRVYPLGMCSYFIGITSGQICVKIPSTQKQR